MGVPAFYRWLSSRYPKTVRDCIEDLPGIVNGTEVPVDTSQPNPNGIEFDNLYLDMNGIIHPCFHPEDRPAPTTETEVFLAIYDYIDRLFSIVRPRKVLYMAIDGVAPRAKMNQQRSRRFRAAQDAEEKERDEERIRQEFAKQGIRIPKKERGESSVFDSNVITPGTPFMHRLSVALQYYVHMRLNTDPGWRDLKVILSDANCPGEGEHKVMAFIRQQRAQPDHDPNTRHCVYGLDADLIMLALSTHEPKFAILREVVFQPQPSNQQNRLQEASVAALLEQKEPQNENGDSKPEVARKPYQFLMVNVLREYLERELRVPAPFEIDKERLFDDFVFMCFFVGNDFLPHMPTLEIREGAIELLMATYKRMLPALGHLVEGAHVHLDRVEKFIAEVGAYEDAIFQKRMRLLRRQKDRRRQQQQQQKREQRRKDDEAGKQSEPYDRYKRGNQMDDTKKNLKWTSRPPPAEIAANAKSIVSSMSKSAKLAAAIKASLKPESFEMPKAKASEVPSNKDAAQLLRKRMREADDRIDGQAQDDEKRNENRGRLDEANENGSTSKEEKEEMVQQNTDARDLKAKEKKRRVEEGKALEDEAKISDAVPSATDREEKATDANDGEIGSSSMAKHPPKLLDAEVVKQKREELLEVEGKSGERAVVVASTSVTSASALWEEMGGDAGSEVPKIGDAEPHSGDVDDTELDDEEREVEDELNEMIGDADVDAEAAARAKESVEKFREKLKEEVKEKADKFDEMVAHEERIRLGEAGFKDRYYEEKLGIKDPVRRGAAVRQLVRAYVEGLVWVMRYYYDGVASWTWYYPFHYAPFASDLVGIGDMKIEFEVGEPFKPFDQLMGVLPAASAHALPQPYRPLFTDKHSPILDFYPDQFEVDMNGKRFAWQGVALLPFIDEARLLEATRSKEPMLSVEEVFRNSRRYETLYVAGSHPLAPDIFEISESVADVADEERIKKAQKIDASSSHGMAGSLAPISGEPCPAVIPVPYRGLGDDITSNSVVAAAYLLPDHRPHILGLLPGAQEDAPELTELDVLPEMQLWHEDRRHQNNNRQNGQYWPRSGRDQGRSMGGYGDYTYTRHDYHMQSYTYPGSAGHVQGDAYYGRQRYDAGGRGHSEHRHYRPSGYDYRSNDAYYSYSYEQNYPQHAQGRSYGYGGGAPPQSFGHAPYDARGYGYCPPYYAEQQGYQHGRGRRGHEDRRSAPSYSERDAHPRQRGQAPPQRPMPPGTRDYGSFGGRSSSNNPYAALQRDRR